ncbi:MAG: site-specific integrase [Actinomycetota bacterium]|nr:site-specific integrase [Actinomycetota bacterium]
MLVVVRGSIRQRGPSTWQIRVCAGRDPVTGRYRYVSRTVEGNKRAAQRAAADLVVSVERGQVQPGRGTVAKLLEQWMAHIEVQGRAASTLVRYRSAIKVNIVPAIGHLQVPKLTGADLDAFYASLLRRGLNPLSVRKCHAILSAALHQAVRWGWLERSPIARCSPPSAPSKEIVPPTVEEVRRLLELCEKSHADLGSLIYAAVTTGCRRGELCALRWDDVDFEKATLVVARSISDVPGDVSVKDTKTHQARRLALDPSTIEVLLRQRARAEERAAAAGCTLAGSAYVWSQALDASIPYRPDRVTGAFRGLRERAGLPHLTLQGMRHFAATALAGRGVAVRTIAGRLGHANPNLTLRTYAHFLDVADRDAADVMAGLGLSLGAADGADSRSEVPPSTS